MSNICPNCHEPLLPEDDDNYDSHLDYYGSYCCLVILKKAINRVLDRQENAHVLVDIGSPTGDTSPVNADVSKWIIFDYENNETLCYFDNSQFVKAHEMCAKLNATKNWHTTVMRLPRGSEFFANQMHVRVTVKDKKDYQPNAVVARSGRDQQEGVIINKADSHGLCYEVEFDDGKTAWFDPDELALV